MVDEMHKAVEVLIVAKTNHITSSTDSFSMTELSREFNLSPRTLRLYEAQELLRPTRINNRRVYSSADRTRLKLILRGKRLGFSLVECQEILNLYDPLAENKKHRSQDQLEVLLEKISEHRKHLRQQLKGIEVILNELDFTEQRCLQSLGIELVKTRLTQPPISQPSDNAFR